MNYQDFDVIEYIKQIAEKNKFAKENKFKFFRISGIGDAEELVANMRRENGFIAVDDTPESSIIARVNGPVERNLQSVFILYRFDSRREDSRIDAETKCKTLLYQFLTKLLHDKEELKDAMVYLDADIQSRILGSVLNGVTGLYFTFSYDKPIKLCYKADEWT